jgi:hypothetical protein
VVLSRKGEGIKEKTQLKGKIRRRQGGRRQYRKGRQCWKLKEKY